MAEDKSLFEKTTDVVKSAAEKTTFLAAPSLFTPEKVKETARGLEEGTAPKSEVVDFGTSGQGLLGTGLGILGVGMEQERVLPPLDYGKFKVPKDAPSVRDLYDFSKPEIANRFNTAKAVVNAQGRSFRLTDNMNLAERINFMDKVGAIRYVADDNEVIPIAWKRGFAKAIKIPEEVTVRNPQTTPTRDVKVVPDFMEEEFVTLKTKDIGRQGIEALNKTTRVVSTESIPDEKLATALTNYNLAQHLTKNGFNDRQITMIIADRAKSPTYNDMMGLVKNVGDATARFSLEVGFWAAGEVGDTITLGLTDFKLFNPKGRQEVVDRMYKTHPQRIQDYYYEKGVVLNLSQASSLASYYTGYIYDTAQLTAEIVLPSKIALARVGLKGDRELERYEAYRDSLLSGPWARDLSEDAILSRYIETYSKTQNKHVGTTIGSKFEKGRAKRIEERLAIAYQNIDAALPEDERAMVIAKRQRYSGFLARGETLRNKLKTYELSDSGKDKAEIDKLRSKIQENDKATRNAFNDLEITRNESRIPKYIRDQNVQDTFIISGAIGAGYVLEEMDFLSEDFAELGGMGAGMVAYFLKMGTPAAVDTLLKLSIKRNPNSVKGAEFVLKELAKAGPEMQAVANEAMTVAGEISNTLSAAGADPELMRLTLPAVIGFVSLQHLSRSVNQTANVKDLADIDGAMAKDYQSIAMANRELNIQLNDILLNMGNIENAGEGTAELLRIIREMEKRTRDEITTIKKNVDEARKDSASSYLDFINGKVDDQSLTVTDINNPTGYPEAINNLMDRGYIFRDPNAPITNQIYDESTVFSVKEIHSDTQKKIDSAIKSARTKLRFTDEKSRDNYINRASNLSDQSTNLPRDINASGLFAYHLQTKKSYDRRNASAIFKYLNGQEDTNPVIYYVDGQLVDEGELSVNVFSMFSDVREQAQVGIARLKTEKEGFSRLEAQAIEDEMVALSMPFIEQMADSANTTVEDFMKTMVKKVKEDAGDAIFYYRDGKKRNEKAVVMEYMHTQLGENSVLFNLKPSEFLEFEQRYSSALYNIGTPASESLNLSLKGKFDEFTLNGNPVERIEVKHPRTGDAVDLGMLLQQAKDDWYDYKKVWVDKKGGQNLFAKWFKVDSRKQIPASATHPLGIETNVLASEWLQIDDLADSNKAANFMVSMQQGLGVVREGIGESGEKVLVLGDPDTDLLQQSVIFAFEEFLIKESAKIKGDPLKIMDVATSLSQNLKVYDQNGNLMPLIQVGDIIDDVLGYGTTKTIAKEVRDKADREAIGLINSATDKMLEVPETLLRQKEDLADMVSSQMGIQKATNTQAINFLIQNPERVEIIRDGLLGLRDDKGLPKYTEDQVQSMLRSATFDFISQVMFVPSGIARVSEIKQSGKVVISDLIKENPAALNSALKGTPESEKAMRLLLGEEGYKTAESIVYAYGLMKNNPLLNDMPNVRGIPRSLSFESYISRIYAINRGVVRPQYVGTEALLQKLRNDNFDMITAMINDPELGSLLIEVAQTGALLDPKREKRLQILLAQAAVVQSSNENRKTTEFEDTTGRSYTLNAIHNKNINQ